MIEYPDYKEVSELEHEGPRYDEEEQSTVNESERQEFMLDMRESMKIEGEQEWQRRDPYETQSRDADMARAHSLLEALRLEEEEEEGFEEAIEYVFGDMVNSPAHYKQGDMEAIDVINNYVPDFHSYCMGNVLKYVLRHLQKNGKQDLEKARWYLERMIKDY